jgi:GT2 family glycosyltransferase
MKRLSISIVIYEGYEDCLCAVKSIEEATSPELEKQIYLIDNSDQQRASQAEKELKAYAAEHSDITYIANGKNIGFGAGHNLVLKDLDSAYHAIVNPDIILKEDAFSKILDFMDENPDIGMVIPRILTEDGELQKVYRRDLTIRDMFIRMFCGNHFQKRQDYHTMQDMDYEKVFDLPFGQGSFLVIRTELLKKIEGFDDRFFLYMEDADLCKRLRQKARFVYFPGASVIHKWEKGSHKSKKLFRIHVSSMIKYFCKWGIFGK